MKHVLLPLLCAAGLLSAPEAHAQTLNIAIDKPAGISVSVKVSGPGFEATVAQNAVLRLPGPGTYTCSAQPVRRSNPVADELFELPEVSVEAKADSTHAVALAFRKRKGTGMLWLPDRPGKRLLGYAAHQLLKKEAAAPAIALDLPSEAVLCASDLEGNLWYWDNEQLHLIRHRQVQNGTPNIAAKRPVPQASEALFNINRMLFDAQGMLWMMLHSEQRMIGFAPETLAGKGALQPDVTLQLPVAGIDFAFSPDRSLLAVACVGGVATYRLPAALKGNVSPPPAGASDEFGTCTAVAFTPEGSLWVANENGGVFLFAPAAFSKPKFRNTSAGFELQTNEYIYWGLHVDRNGGLWCATRMGDGGTALDYFDWEGLQPDSAPTHRFLLEYYSEHGKFAVNLMPK